MSKAVLLKCLPFSSFMYRELHVWESYYTSSSIPTVKHTLQPAQMPNCLPKGERKFDISTGFITHHYAEWKMNSEELLNWPVPIWVFQWFLKTKTLERWGKSRIPITCGLRQQKILYFLGAADTLVPLPTLSTVTGFEQLLLPRGMVVMEENQHWTETGSLP